MFRQRLQTKMYRGAMSLAFLAGVVRVGAGQVTLSTYGFERSQWDLAGPYFAVSTPIPGNQAGLLALSPPTMKLASSLSLMRPANEIVYPLKGLAAAILAMNPLKFLGPGMKMLHDDASDVTATFVPLTTATDFVGSGPDPLTGNHAAAMVGIRIAFHLNTSPGCYAHEGNITYQVLFSIPANGVLHGHTNGGTFTRDVNPDICAGDVNSNLRTRAQDGLAWINLGLLAWLQRVAAQRTFTMVYLIPGDGERSIYGPGDADLRVSLGVVP